MSLTSVIKAQSCSTKCWPFHLWEQNKGTFEKKNPNHYTRMLIENDFVNVPPHEQTHTHTHTYANKHSLKGQLFCFGTLDLSHENIDRGKGSIAKCGLKMRWAKSTASYLYSERLPSYKYWKKDTGGERKRPNGAFEKWHTWAPHGISSPPVRSHPIWSK